MEDDKKYQSRFLGVTLGLFLLSLILFWFMGKWPLPKSFHNFADERSFFGIPNFMDVISNLPFFIFGLMGLVYSLKSENTRKWGAANSWRAFFLGVLLVAPGSAFYHLNPNHFTLVWDRLPMTLSFMAVFSALLTELFWPKFEKYLLTPLILIGFSSVFYWYWTEMQSAGDMRFYAWVQGFPLITIPFAFWLGKKPYTHYSLVLLCLACYALAKITEIYDVLIYQALESTVSGHSLKHILASLGALGAFFMLKKRHPISN